jgi:hypothetical protein
MSCSGFDHGSQFQRRAHPSQSDAGDPDYKSGVRPLAGRRDGRGAETAAAVGGGAAGRCGVARIA